MLFPIRSKRKVAENTTEVTLQIPKDRQASFIWKPGQTVEATVPEMYGKDTRGSARIFSIVSAPHESPAFALAFRNSPSAWKQGILEMPVGEEIDISKPFGYFTLPEDTARPLTFIAGGIGIAPFISMLRHIKKNALPHPITLIYANSNAERIAYREELLDFKKQLPSFSLTLHTGKITTLKKGKKDTLFYVAGPTEMVVNVSKLLEKSGILHTSVLTEAFTGC